YESLSLVALEAWAQGVPVLADARCEVLAGHLRRGGGGRAVATYDALAAALDDLWAQPRKWQALGRPGQDYVRSRSASQDNVIQAMEDAVRDLKVHLAERLRRRGLERAAENARSAWRGRFAGLVEELFDQPARPYREQVEVEPRTGTRTVLAGTEAVLVSVRVHNRGTHAALADGPARVVLGSPAVDANGQPCGPAGPAVPLPA